MSFVSNLSVGKKLYAAFAAVSIIFTVALVVTIVYGQKSRSAWQRAESWNVAVAASQEQISGTRQQWGAQALYVATFLPRYKAEWEAGVGMSDKGTKVIQGLGDPVIAQIADSANTADHHHDDTVHNLLFPAVRAATIRRPWPR